MTYSCLGIYEMPHNMANGQQIMFRSYNPGLNVTQLKLQRIDSSSFIFKLLELIQIIQLLNLNH